MYSTTIVRTTRNSGTIRAAARTAAVVFGLFIGTGSNAASMVVERSNVYGKPKSADQLITATKQESKPDGVDLRSTRQHLENIKASLNLPMSETASVFGVARQSIYKWLSGASAPEQDKLVKIIELSRIADIFRAEEIDRPSELLRMKAFNGKSILDLVKNGEDYSQLLPVLIQESKNMDLAYSRSNISKLPQGRTSDWKSSISIPFSDDV